MHITLEHILHDYLLDVYRQLLKSWKPGRACNDTASGFRVYDLGISWTTITYISPAPVWRERLKGQNHRQSLKRDAVQSKEQRVLASRSGPQDSFQKEDQTLEARFQRLRLARGFLQTWRHGRSNLVVEGSGAGPGPKLEDESS